MTPSDAIAIAHEVDDFIKTHTPTQPVELPASDGIAVWLSARAFSTFRGALLLLDASAVDEAMTLARGLSTDGLRLLELERLGPNRHSLLLGWQLKAITESEHLMDEAVRVGLERDPRPVLDALAARRDSVMAYAARRGLPEPRPQDFPTDKALAKRFDCMQDYWSFRYANQVVHGTPVTVGHRLTKAPDGTYLFDTRASGASGASFADGTALFLSRYVLFAFGGLLSVLGHKKPHQYSELLNRIEALNSQR